MVEEGVRCVGGLFMIVKGGGRGRGAYCLFCLGFTSMVISGWAPGYDSAHSRCLYSAAPL